jgi:hypothetical protein
LLQQEFRQLSVAVENRQQQRRFAKSLGLVHGRAFGEASANPNPDKEAALSKEMGALIDTFKSDIVPLSYERRH